MLRWDWAWLHLDDTLEFQALGVGVAEARELVPCTADYRTSIARRSPRCECPPALGAHAALARSPSGLARRWRYEVHPPGGSPRRSQRQLIFGCSPSMLMMIDDRSFSRSAQVREDQAISWGLAQIEAGSTRSGSATASVVHLTRRSTTAVALALPPRDLGLPGRGRFLFLHNSEEAARWPAPRRDASGRAHGWAGFEISLATEALRGRQAIMGNVDPIAMLTDSSASEVAAEAGRQVRLMAGGGCILNSGECVPREARRENMHAMADTARQVWGIVGPRG